MKILGICGSLRKGSFNRGLLRAAQELTPESVTIEIYDIGDIPPYDADIDSTRRPDSVLRFKQAIADADALLIASPEYNASFPGVLKNAIDWASRPLSETPLMGKPAAVMGASGGLSGTARAHVALAPVLDSCGVLVMPKPNVMVRQAAKMFDDEGRLVDQDTREHVQRLVESLVKWARKVNE
jgi:chromate reductase, NAD(P)H dehydrogenase (quinone)